MQETTCIFIFIFLNKCSIISFNNKLSYKWVNLNHHLCFQECRVVVCYINKASLQFSSCNSLTFMKMLKECVFLKWKSKHLESKAPVLCLSHTFHIAKVYKHSPTCRKGVKPISSLCNIICTRLNEIGKRLH